MNQIKPPDFASPQFKANPYPFYARLRAEAPIYRATVPLPFRRAAWLVSRYDDVLILLKDERFAKEYAPKLPWFRFGLIRALMRHLTNLDPPDHTRLRTLVSRAFTPRLIERLRDRIQSVCDDLLDAAAPNGRMELVRGYALPLPLTIISELLGIPPQDRLRFHSWTNSLAAAFSGIGGLLRALPKMWPSVRYLRKLFAERSAEPHDDLVTALVQAEAGGDRLSEDELLAMVGMLLLAGHETTINLIGSGTLALLQHPQQRDRLQQNPALAESAIEELLRYTSPADFTTPRVTRQEVRIGDVTIPRGELVFGVLGSANHDETQFPDPETLDITREPNNHLAFGQGAHFCLGAPLARLEGQIALTTLFRRFPNLRLAEAPDSLRWRKGLFLRGLEQLPIAF